MAYRTSNQAWSKGLDAGTYYEYKYSGADKSLAPTRREKSYIPRIL